MTRRLSVFLLGLVPGAAPTRAGRGARCGGAPFVRDGRHGRRALAWDREGRDVVGLGVQPQRADRR